MTEYYIKAVEIMRSAVRRSFDFQTVPIEQALNRVCAQDDLSTEKLPLFGNSAMDGFGVVSSQTQSASVEHPLRFPVFGLIAAGDAPPVGAIPGVRNGAWEMMTGAPFPAGFDSSVKIEDVRVRRDSEGSAIELEVTSPVPAGQHYRAAGEDFDRGTWVTQRGTVVTPETILALAALGMGDIQVVRRPRVALISTGKEIVSLKDRHSEFQVRNSTAPYLKAAFSRFGAEVIFESTVSDDVEQFYHVMRKVMDTSPKRDGLPDLPDLIVTTGGVSMGKHDFVPSALRDLGARIGFHKVAIRPGKPILFAEFPETKKRTVVFGLPGNPISSVVGFRFFIEPYLRQWMGRKPEMPWKAQLVGPYSKPEGIRCFLKAKIDPSLNSARVEILPGQESFRIQPLLESNGWVVLPEQKEKWEAGDWVEFYPLHPGIF